MYSFCYVCEKLEAQQKLEVFRLQFWICNWKAQPNIIQSTNVQSPNSSKTYNFNKRNHHEKTYLPITTKAKYTKEENDSTVEPL